LLKHHGSKLYEEIERDFDGNALHQGWAKIIHDVDDRNPMTMKLDATKKALGTTSSINY